MAFHKVAKVTDLKDGEATTAQVGEKMIAIFQIGESYYAIDNGCSHVGGPLCDGYVSEKKVKCPWHGAEFDCKTGKLIAFATKIRDLASYKTTVDGDSVFIET